MQLRTLAYDPLMALVIALMLPNHGATAATPLGATFTYQGRLTQSGSPVNGNADFQFSLWDGPAPGTQVTPILPSTTLVTDGTFTVDLNFGSGAFNGDERWLEIAVRFPAGVGSFTALTPRQRLNAAPYALALPGMLTQPNATSPNIIGGFNGNTVSANVIGATISGGGETGDVNAVLNNFGTVGGGSANSAQGNWATIAGGTSNSANATSATIGGGCCNNALGSSSTIGGGAGNLTNENHSTVGGGEFNAATEGHSTVSGGQSNTASTTNSTVGGGFSNVANGPGLGSSTVGGGWDNTASGEFSTVAAGFQNTASGSSSAVGGGASNFASGSGSTIAGGGANGASGIYSTVAGGLSNVALGSYSFAAGRRAKANHNGAFVWGDSTDANVSSFATNTFTARAVNGFIFYTNSGLTSGAAMGAGAGSWTSLSDRNRKRDIRPIDAQDILAKVLALPITSWSYDSQDPSIRHIGPMAQDFNPAFGIGEFENGITTIDADGVALAAIQGLHQALLEKEAAISQLRETAAAQASEMARLKAQLDELRAAIESTARSASANE